MLASAKTVVWNGPMGVFELAPLPLALAALPRRSPRSTVLTVVGGGDSAAAVRQLGIGEAGFSHISTVAAPRWSSLKARRCQASRHWRDHEQPRSPAPDGRQLEDEPLDWREAHLLVQQLAAKLTREAAHRRRGGRAAAVRRHPQRAGPRSTTARSKFGYGSQDISQHAKGA